MDGYKCAGQHLGHMGIERSSKGVDVQSKARLVVGINTQLLDYACCNNTNASITSLQQKLLAVFPVPLNAADATPVGKIREPEQLSSWLWSSNV